MPVDSWQSARQMPATHFREVFATEKKAAPQKRRNFSNFRR